MDSRLLLESELVGEKGASIDDCEKTFLRGFVGVFRLQRRVPIVEGDLREHRGRRVRLFWTFLECFF